MIIDFGADTIGNEDDFLFSVKKYWWVEEDFVFKGFSATAYLWPRDRLIHFVESTEHGIQNTILIPTFHLDVANHISEKNGLTTQMDAAIGEYFRLEKEETDVIPPVHLHVIKVNGLNEYGIVVSKKKMAPVVDCWADSEARKNITIKRLDERAKK